MVFLFIKPEIFEISAIKDSSKELPMETAIYNESRT